MVVHNYVTGIMRDMNNPYETPKADIDDKIGDKGKIFKKPLWVPVIIILLIIFALIS